MVLHDVANCAGFFVEFASSCDAERFGHGDLYAVYIIAVPDRFEERIRKTEEKQVFDLFLAEIMIDAKDRGFRKHGVQDRVELLSGRLIAAKGFFQNYAGI